MEASVMPVDAVSSPPVPRAVDCDRFWPAVGTMLRVSIDGERVNDVVAYDLDGQWVRRIDIARCDDDGPAQYLQRGAVVVEWDGGTPKDQWAAVRIDEQSLAAIVAAEAAAEGIELPEMTPRDSWHRFAIGFALAVVVACLAGAFAAMVWESVRL